MHDGRFTSHHFICCAFPLVLFIIPSDIDDIRKYEGHVYYSSNKRILVLNIGRHLHMEHTEKIRNMHYQHPTVVKYMSDMMITNLPKTVQDVVVVCIGTDRSTGDALGPLTGSLFAQMKPAHIKLYGTLHHPVHALNLQHCIQDIYGEFNHPFIIAVDASLGNTPSIGCFTCNKGALQPGAALGKKLPEIGDAHITGVVNYAGKTHYDVLQSTRLSVVHDMAEQLALILQKVDIWLHYYKFNQARNKTFFKRKTVYKG